MQAADHPIPPSWHLLHVDDVHHKGHVTESLSAFVLTALSNIAHWLQCDVIRVYLNPRCNMWHQQVQCASYYTIVMKIWRLKPMFVYSVKHHMIIDFRSFTLLQFWAMQLVDVDLMKGVAVWHWECTELTQQSCASSSMLILCSLLLRVVYCMIMG